LIDVVPIRGMNEGIVANKLTAADFHDVLMATGKEYAGVSWGGFNLFGDVASIDEFKRLQHQAGTVEDLRRALAAAHSAALSTSEKP
jgi:hypothetical protein